MQLKYIFATKRDRITVSYHPKQQILLCIWLLERANFNYLDYSYTIWYVYNESSIRARTKIVRRKHIIQPTGFDAYSPTSI